LRGNPARHLQRRGVRRSVDHWQVTALTLDLQVPQTSAPPSLVVYLPGGGFMTASKDGNLAQRTHVAEHGYAVASIEYRTIADGHSSGVQAVTDEFGPANLATIGADFDPATRQSYTAPGNFVAKFVFGPGTTRSVLDDAADVAAADPARYISAMTPLHGRSDGRVAVV
jgi:hypothetical protein